MITRLFRLALCLAAVSVSHSASSLEFSNFADRATQGADLSVVFFGGSLTWGAMATDPQEKSWRALISKKLQQTYPRSHFRFWDAAIGGTGSQLGAFRLERDVLAQKPDLVFLDFTVNDGPFSPPDPGRLASYESLVRRLLEKGVPVVQVILPVKGDVGPKPGERPLDPKHREIAAAYGLPVADVLTFARQKVTAGQTTPDALWDVPDDSTHPGDAGYAVYADSVWNTFQQAVKEGAVCRVPEKMLHAGTYLTVTRNLLSSFPALPSGWRTGQPHRQAIAFDFVCSRWLDTLAIAQPDAAPLRLNVQAADILLFGEQTKESGSYEVSIDGGAPETFSARCADGNMRLVEMIAQGLDPQVVHQVVITPVLKPGEELRLESVCAAGAPATVSLK